MANASVGLKLKIGSNYVAGLKTVPAPELSADTLDTTTLDNETGYRTFIGSWKDAGEIAVTGQFEFGDAGQDALLDSFNAGTVETFQILFPAALGASWNFQGVVTKYQAGSADLDNLLSFAATIKISGEPTFAEEASAGLSGLSLSGTGGTLSPSFDDETYFYTFSGVSATSVTVTATASDQTIKLYINGVYSADLTSGSASAAIPLTISIGKKLTILAWEDGKAPVTYEVIAVKSS